MSHDVIYVLLVLPCIYSVSEAINSKNLYPDSFNRDHLTNVHVFNTQCAEVTVAHYMIDDDNSYDQDALAFIQLIVLVGILVITIVY